MNRRSFLKGASVIAGAAAVPFNALVARAQTPTHQGGVRRGHTADYGPLFPTRDESTGHFSSSEWAGACYSPDGKWLFANLQSPGISIAITGPWKSGAL